MTNFHNPASPQRRPSREQVLLAFPMAVAALAAIALLLVWVLPQWRQRQVLVGKRDAILHKRQQLDRQRQALATAQQQVQQEVNRQARILALIAPTYQLDTMLTALAEAAHAQDVQLVRYEPRQSVGIAPAAPAGEDPSATTGGEPEPGAPTGDPLLATGLKKQEILLTFEGSYDNILAVLQGLELLQPLTVAHDVKLESYSPSGDQPRSTRPVTTRMNLRLTVYVQAQEA